MGSSPAGEEEQPLTPGLHTALWAQSTGAFLSHCPRVGSGLRTGGSWGGQRSCLNYKHNEEHPTLRGTRAEAELGALG